MARSDQDVIQALCRALEANPTDIPHSPPESKPTTVWKGPEEDGITFSLLSKFLVDRERFRLLVVEGLKAREGFNHKLGYGNMWHVCEEAWANTRPEVRQEKHRTWPEALLIHSKMEADKYHYDQEAIAKWYGICKMQFPHYIKFWQDHPDMVVRESLLEEFCFKVPYRLPSGRTVLLRGKWDSVDLIDGNVWLQENKTKGDINRAQMERQLRFDLQTMLYLIALEQDRTNRMWFEKPIAGVRYNVVRRPLAGGKYTIRPHAPTKKNPRGESDQQFLQRLSDIIKADPRHFFIRWNVEVSHADLERFKVRCLNPILEQLCDWWTWVRFPELDPFSPGIPSGLSQGITHARYGIHWQAPFGIYNPLHEGRGTEYDECLDTGSEIGLTRTTDLFPELHP